MQIDANRTIRLRVIQMAPERDGQSNRQSNRQTDRQADRQTGRQADRQTDRQTVDCEGADSIRYGGPWGRCRLLYFKKTFNGHLYMTQVVKKKLKRV